MVYAGVGSRNTPQLWLTVFEEVAELLSKDYGAVLRSGAADGADYHFEKGCNNVYGKKEIYLPWKGFNGSQSDLIVENPDAFEIARKFTPYWDGISQGAKKLKARNVHQILGNNLHSPADFIVCWTENGAIKGGTGLALQMANYYDITVVNAGSYGSNIELFMQTLKSVADKYYNSPKGGLEV